MKSLHLTVSGRVQGVGYRAFIADEAASRGISGWVRNRRDGSVELAVSGEDRALDDFVAACRRGPRGSKIDALAVVDHAAPIADGFLILPTK
jgi:acylphosphatase